MAYPNRLFYDGDFKLTLLAEELYAAFPQLVAGPLAKIKVVQTSSGVLIIVPSDVNPADVALVVNKHKSTGKSKQELDRAEYTQKANTLKAKLVQQGFTQDEIVLLLG